MEDLNTLVNESAVIVDQIQKEFSTFEILIVSVLPIAMIVSSLLGFKIWLKVNVFFSFFYGIVMILRPETILSISVKSFKWIALFVKRHLYIFISIKSPMKLLTIQWERCQAYTAAMKYLALCLWFSCCQVKMNLYLSVICGQIS